MSNTSKIKRHRNLSLCPITEDPTEIMELISELKAYLNTVEFRNDSIYEAYYAFDYEGVRYRMDNSVLSTSPAVLYKARDYIVDRLEQLGAENIGYCSRED